MAAAVVAGAVCITCKMPLNLSLKTRITPVPDKSATVTAEPPKNTSGRVTPDKVRVIGSVAVVPVGIGFATLTVKRPAGSILL